MNSNINLLPLHDAVLYHIELCWEQRICRLFLSLFLEQIQTAQPHILEFFGVSNLLVPHESPWGDSVLINTVTQITSGIYYIEIQSGDTIIITASDFKFSLK